MRVAVGGALVCAVMFSLASLACAQNRYYGDQSGYGGYRDYSDQDGGGAYQDQYGDTGGTVESDVLAGGHSPAAIFLILSDNEENEKSSPRRPAIGPP